MSTWSDGGTRSTVLRGGAAALARPARMDAELRTTPYASGGVVDARLTDPHLEDVVAAARRKAVGAGTAQGFAEGYASGLAAAAADAAVLARQVESERARTEEQRRVQAEQALAVLATVTRAFEQRDAVAVADVEDVVADLALQVARAVLGRELALSSDPGAEAVARALALAPDGCPATARLHPDDVAALAPTGALAPGRELTVVADPAVERGGCVVQAAGRLIDAQVGTALERVAAALR